MDQLKITDWIVAASSAVTTITVIFMYTQTKWQKKEIKEDHERSRREKAVELLLHWNQSLNMKNSLARKFAETLSEEVLRNIFNSEEFYLDNCEKTKANLEFLFSNSSENVSLKVQDGHIIVDKKNSTWLRWELITYLNLLEAVVSSWVYNVSDRDLIESEFEYLFKQSGGGLKTFRKVSGNSFPCVDLFELKMIEKNKSKLKEKFLLGTEERKA